MLFEHDKQIKSKMSSTVKIKICKKM